MEISLFGLKILRYIKKHSSIKNEKLQKKFGSYCIYTLDELYRAEYISCPTVTGGGDGIYFAGLPSDDDWNITDKGLCLLADKRAVLALTVRQRIIYGLGGFIIGLVTAFASGIIQKLVDYLWSSIIN